MLLFLLTVIFSCRLPAKQKLVFHRFELCEAAALAEEITSLLSHDVSEVITQNTEKGLGRTMND